MSSAASLTLLSNQDTAAFFKECLLAQSCDAYCAPGHDSHVRSPHCRVKTPNYEVYGAMTVDIRVNISGEGWTVNKIQFNYFANTSAKNCLAYGPGLLPQVRSAGVTWWSIHSLATWNYCKEFACKASSSL